MSRRLDWLGPIGVAEAGGRRVTLAARPAALPSDAQQLAYADGAGKCLAADATEWRVLTPEECAALDAVVAEAVSAHDGPQLVHCVDDGGRYLGQFDAAGHLHQVACAPPSDDPGWRWGGQAWRLVPSLAQAIADAEAEIDTAAGAARARYITVVPGQEAVYLRKQAQAEQFAAAGFEGDVPPYIAAEAAATGVTPEQLAREVLARAGLWDGQVGPAIEATRIAGKAAVRAAADPGSAQTSARDALQALAAI